MTNEDYQKIFHEIKNYITFINSSLQLVEKKHPKIKSDSYWTDAMQEITALKTMLIELSSARLSDKINAATISTENFIRDFSLTCNTIFSDSFHCDLQFREPVPDISGDPERLKRALFNLLKNSYEAMHGTGIVNLMVSRQDSHIRLDIIDHGGGIPTEYLPKLFTPFETTKSSGTGLGLLITRQIIESHGGYLTLDSRPQDGCTFSVFLPCAV